MDPYHSKRTLSPSELLAATQLFYQSMSKLKNIQLFLSFFCFVANMTFEEAELFCSVVRGAGFQLLFHLIAQGTQFNFKMAQNAVVVSAHPSTVRGILKDLVKEAPFKELATYVTKINNDNVVGFGSDQEHAQWLSNFLRMIDNDLSHILIGFEMGNASSKIMGIINHPRFVPLADHIMNGIDCPVPGALRALMTTLCDSYRLVSSYTKNKEGSLFASLYVFESRLAPLIEYLGSVVSPMASLVPLIDIYSHSTPMDLAVSLNFFDDSKSDPVVLTKNDPAFVSLNTQLSLRKDIYYSNPNEAVQEIYDSPIVAKTDALDEFVESQRAERAKTVTWDEHSGKLAKLVNIDLATATINNVLGGAPSDKVFAFNGASSQYVAIQAFQTVHHFGPKIDDSHNFVNCTPQGPQNFIKIIRKEKGEATVVIDNLQLTSSEVYKKTWITKRNNSKVMSSNLAILLALFGKPSDIRQTIDTVPKVLIWRTFVPTDKANTLNFYNALTRLQVFYHVNYYPPAGSHEVQFTLLCFRRSAIEQNKFLEARDDKGDIIPGGKKVKLSYIIPMVDFARRYYGSVYRHMVFRSVVSRVASVVVKRAVIDAVHKTGSVNYDKLQCFDKLVNEFKFSSDEEKATIREFEISSLNLGFTGAKAGNAKKQRNAEHRKQMAYQASNLRSLFPDN